MIECKGRKIGYLRVSRPEQSVDRQIDGLKPFCDEMRIERTSAVAKSRPVFDKLMSELREGDTLIVYDIDRAFRSLIDAIVCSEEIIRRGVGFRIVTMTIDPATRHGRLIYSIMAVIAQHEREHLAERTKEGMAAARRRGVRLGRPPKLSNRQIVAARRKLERNEATLHELAKDYCVHPVTLSRALARLSLS